MTEKLSIMDLEGEEVGGGDFLIMIKRKTTKILK
jgi:hypothetical protein